MIFEADDRSTWPTGDGPWLVICMGDENGDTIKCLAWLPDGDGHDPAWLDAEVVEYVWIGIGRDYSVDLSSLSSADGWTSVEKALPDDELTVLAHGEEDSEPVWMAYVDSESGTPQWFTVEGAATTPAGEPGWGPVTHWRPLPAPPNSDDR